MDIAPFEHALIWYARKFPLRRGKLRVINTLWPLAVGRDDTRRTAKLVYRNYRVPCDLAETLQRQFYFFGTYFLEQTLLNIWHGLAKNALTVFDVGANAGIYSLAALASNPEARVYAFEPTAEIARRLRATVALNGLDHLSVEEAAVMDVPGHVSLVRCRGLDGANDGMNFILKETDRGEVVRAESLDAFCKARSIDRIDLLKIDVQGQEASVLKGATKLLRESRIGEILIELNWWTPGDPRCPAAESVRILQGFGFRFAPPAEVLVWQCAGDWMRDLSDVLAKRV